MAQEGGDVIIPGDISTAPVPPKRPTIIRHGNIEGLENGSAAPPPIPARSAPPPPAPRPSKDSNTPPSLPPGPRPSTDGPVLPPLPPGPHPSTTDRGAPPPLPPGPRPKVDQDKPPPLPTGPRPLIEGAAPSRPVPPKPGPPQRPISMPPQVPSKPPPPAVAQKSPSVASSMLPAKPTPPSKSSKQAGSVKKRPEITIVAARPMSEVGFRTNEATAPPPSVESPKTGGSSSQFPGPDEGEPPPPYNVVKPDRPAPIGGVDVLKRSPPPKPGKPPPRPASIQGGAPVEGRGPPPPIPASRIRSSLTPLSVEEPAPLPPRRSTSLKTKGKEAEQQDDPVEELISFEEQLSTEEQPIAPTPSGRPTIISRPRSNKGAPTHILNTIASGGSESADTDLPKPATSLLPPKPKPKPQPKPTQVGANAQSENMNSVIDKNLTALREQSDGKPSVSKKPPVVRSLPNPLSGMGEKGDDSVASQMELTDFDPLANKTPTEVPKLEAEIKPAEPVKSTENPPQKLAFRPTIIPKSNSGTFKGSTENVSSSLENLSKQQDVKATQPSQLDLLTDDTLITEREIESSKPSKKMFPARPSAGPPAKPAPMQKSPVQNIIDADLPVIEKKSSPPGRPKSMPPPRPSANPPARPVAAPSKPKITSHSGAKSKTSGTSGPPPLPSRPGPGHPLFHYVVEGPHGIASYDYEPSQPDELSFKTGDVIVLLRRVDADWLYGKNGDQEGMFPQGFIDVVEPLPEDLWEEEAPEKPDLLTGPRCRARFDFDGEGEDDLNFEDGDVIGLLERVGDEWLRGKLNGKVGVFPLSFVEIIEDLPAMSPPQDETATKFNKTGSKSVKVKAMYDFEGHDGELSFKVGDQITVLSQVNVDWLFGELDGRSGSFPTGFVDHIPSDLPAFDSKKHPASKMDVHPQDEQPSCTALHPFTAEAEGELSFVEGDKILITGNIGGGWLRGKLGYSEGIFPEAFVEISNCDTQDGSSRRGNEDMPKAKALHDFDGQSTDELSFKSGDVIDLLRKVNDDWYSGKIGSKVGQFPINFVEVLVPLP